MVNTCPECDVQPLEMLSWWKAVDPGPFKIESKEYWRAAEVGHATFPPAEARESNAALLTVKDITPKPWKDWPMEYV